MTSLRYKQDSNLEFSISLDSNTENFDLPNENEILEIFDNIQKYFNEKNAEKLIVAMDQLKDYLSFYEVNPNIFQTQMFQTLIDLCHIKDNLEIVLYSFEFICFILKTHINLIPLFYEPQFFEFCSSFLSHPNTKIVKKSLKCINNFVKCGVEGRNYTIEKLTPVFLIDFLINTENVKLSISKKAFSLLSSYCLYNITPEFAHNIYSFSCETLLSENEFFFKYALRSIFNLIQFNPEIHPIILQNDFFPDMIYKNTYSDDSRIILPALNILKFLFLNNKCLPDNNSMISNFLSLLAHKHFEISNLSFDCLYVLIVKQRDAIIENFVRRDFFKQLYHVFESSPFQIKVKAVEIGCLIAEHGNQLVSNKILKSCFIDDHNNRLGCVHIYFLFLTLEDDEIKARIIKVLYNIYSKNYHKYTFRIREEEREIFEELNESSSEIVVQYANAFLETFCSGYNEMDATSKDSSKGKQHNRIRRKRKMIKEESIQIVSSPRPRLWNKSKSPNQINNQVSQYNITEETELSEYSKYYYMNDNTYEEDSF